MWNRLCDLKRNAQGWREPRTMGRALLGGYLGSSSRLVCQRLGKVASLALLASPIVAQAAHPVDDAAVPAPLRPVHGCPRSIEPLADLLLRDLPSYANRVASRSLGLPSDRPSSFGTVIIASQPDLEPLDGAVFGDLSRDLEDPAEIRQIFFTTLERQYLNNQAVSLQNYHWLFVVQSADGWRPMRLYSAVGGYPSGARTAPPQESSDGIIGQAVRLWLRDCRAGTVFPLGDATGE